MNDKTSCCGLFLFLQRAKKTCVFRFFLLSEVLAGVNIARNLKFRKSINNFEHINFRVYPRMANLQFSTGSGKTQWRALKSRKFFRGLLGLCSQIKGE
jgi:hypothetical protein